MGWDGGEVVKMVFNSEYGTLFLRFCLGLFDVVSRMFSSLWCLTRGPPPLFSASSKGGSNHSIIRPDPDKFFYFLNINHHRSKFENVNA